MIPNRDVWRDLPFVISDLFKGASPSFRIVSRSVSLGVRADVVVVPRAQVGEGAGAATRLWVDAGASLCNAQLFLSISVLLSQSSRVERRSLTLARAARRKKEGRQDSQRCRATRSSGRGRVSEREGKAQRKLWERKTKEGEREREARARERGRERRARRRAAHCAHVEPPRQLAALLAPRPVESEGERGTHKVLLAEREPDALAARALREALELLGEPVRPAVEHCARITLASAPASSRRRGGGGERTHRRRSSRASSPSRAGTSRARRPR